MRRDPASKRCKVPSAGHENRCVQTPKTGHKQRLKWAKGAVRVSVVEDAQVHPFKNESS